MKLKSLSLALATTALVALTLPVLAQDKSGTNVNTTIGGEAGSAATASMAYELYAMGVKSGDTLTVLTAAKLAASVEGEARDPAEMDPAKVVLEGADQAATRKKAAPAAVPAAPAPVMNGEVRPVAKATFLSGDTDDEEGASEGPATAAQMFAKATELAGDDEAMKGIIADAEAESSRGRIGGSVSWKSKLPRGKVDVWEVPFYGNSYAEVAIVGDGDANLDMVITDENGNVMCYDVSPSDQIYCDFVPAWDGYFYVTVENSGRSRNSYYLLTN